MSRGAGNQPLLFALCVLLAAFAPVAAAQHHGQTVRQTLRVSDSLAARRYQVYDRHGKTASLQAVVAAMDTAEVVFLGEEHRDTVAHTLQRMLLERAYRHYHDTRPLALSLEMFERDVQPVLDEYLADLITERHFLRSSRPWRNYAAYRPLVQFARRRDLPVLAANAPRRYVNRVARQGRSSLQGLPERTRRWLPPLPYPEPSPAYRARWKERMTEEMPAHADNPHDTEATDTTVQHGSESASPHGSGLAHLLDAQVLWDAAMAHTLARHLMRRPDALVLHVTGGFHMEEGRGTPALLHHYRPSAQTLTVAMRPVEDAETFDPEQHTGLADFIVLTEAAPASTSDKP